MRRSTVLSLSLQLVFAASGHGSICRTKEGFIRLGSLLRPLPQKSAPALEKKKVRQKSQGQTNDRLGTVGGDEPSVFDDGEEVGHDDGRERRPDAAASDDIQKREEVLGRPVQQGRLEHLVPGLEQKFLR